MCSKDIDRKQFVLFLSRHNRWVELVELFAFIMSQEEATEESFLKPGQKFATPSPGNGDRVFYETLLQQRPDSEMAQEWCLFYGILDQEEAHKLYVKYCKRKNIAPKAFTASPQKKAAASKVTAVPASKRRKTAITQGGEDDDFAVGDTGLAESKIWESASVPM